MTTPAAPHDNSVFVDGDPSRTGIEPLGVGEGWAASHHTAGGGTRVTSAVLAHGAVEVRAHLVSGAKPGTPVRVTGWSAGPGTRAELLPAVGLDEDLTGVTGSGATLFVALARLTAEPGPAPLEHTVTVTAPAEGELTVRWNGGPVLRVRFDAARVQVDRTPDVSRGASC